MEKNNIHSDREQSKKKVDLLGKIEDHREEVDSKINIDFDAPSDGKSLTNDEDADTDPNKVADKPKFKGNP